MIHQPRNADHPLYKLVDQYLIGGDLKLIAIDLNVQQSTVSKVKCGKQRSARIWKKIIETAMQRKKTEDNAMKQLKQSL